MGKFILELFFFVKEKQRTQKKLTRIQGEQESNLQVTQRVTRAENQTRDPKAVCWQ